MGYYISWQFMHNRDPGEEREKEIENVFEEITTKPFPDLRKETYPGTGSTQGPKQTTPRHN